MPTLDKIDHSDHQQYKLYQLYMYYLVRKLIWSDKIFSNPKYQSFINTYKNKIIFSTKTKKNWDGIRSYELNLRFIFATLTHIES